MKIKDLTSRLAYLRGYHRGRATGRRKGLEEAVTVIAEHTNNEQLELRLSGATEGDLLHLIKAL